MPSPGSMLMTPGRQPGLLQQPHREVRGELLGRRRLPHHGVAHQRRRGRQVAGDRGEVERGDRVDEALQRPVVEPVPDAGGVGDRLLGQDLPGEVHVEAPEVDQLAGGVDLGLDGGLALAEHGRGVERVAPRPGEQVGGLEQDRGPVVEAQRPPGGGGVPRRRDGRPRVVLGRVAQSAEALAVVVRLDDVDLGAARVALLAADRGGQLDVVGGQLLERGSSPARAALPGAKSWTGSLAGAGTWVTASMGVLSDGVGWSAGDEGAEEEGDVRRVARPGGA